MKRSLPRRLEVRQLLILAVLAAMLIGGGYALGERRRAATQLAELGNAVSEGKSARAQELLRAGVDPRQFSEPAGLLACAVIYCDVATAQALLSRGVKVDARFNGGTALNIAIAFRRCDMVELLLKNGADVTAKSAGGHAPLQQMTMGAHRFARHDNDPRLLRLLQDAVAKQKK